MSVRLNHQHETLAEMLGGFTEEELRRRVIPGKWSIFEQIAHLAAYQPAFYNRIHRIQDEDSPVFERYVADNDPFFHELCRGVLSGVLTELKNRRILICAHLHTRSEQVLQRTGLHPKYGKMTITLWTEFFLLHEAHHLFSIFMLAREMNMYTRQA